MNILERRMNILERRMKYWERAAKLLKHLALDTAESFNNVIVLLLEKV